MDGYIGIATVIATIVGLWLAYNFHRQMTVKLAQTRLEAYSRLWVITGIAAPARLDGWGEGGCLRLDERRDLWAAMTDWYYANGDGMLLGTISKQVYLNVKHDLICKWADLRPDCLADRIKKELGLPDSQKLEDDQELENKIRGALAIRLISLLRIQLKSDLTIYGPTHLGKLSSYEFFFLEHSGVDLRSKAWAKAAGLRRRWLPRLRRPVGGSNPTIPGLPQLAPLWLMSPFLDVGGECQKPESSLMAMRKALRGIPAGSAEADSGTPKLLPDDCDSKH
jgi:hypothetical protein